MIVQGTSQLSVYSILRKRVERGR